MAAVYNAITDRTDVGALIPEPVRNEIIKGLPAASAALTLMRQVRMSSKKERQPVLSALPNAYWVQGDTGLKQTTSAEWANQYLEAEELAVVVPIPNAVLDDSAFDLWAELRPLIVEAIGAKIDSAVLFGVDKPAAFPNSVLQGASAAGKVIELGTTHYSGSDNDVAADVNAVMALVEGSNFNVTGFAARTAIKGSLRGMRDKQGSPIFTPSLSAGTPSRLYDVPIVYPDGNGAWENEGVELIAGDWSKAVLGIRQDITYDLFTQGVISDAAGKVLLNLMQQDSTALRVVMRLGFAIANPISRRGGSGYPFAIVGNNPAS